MLSHTLLTVIFMLSAWLTITVLVARKEHYAGLKIGLCSLIAEMLRLWIQDPTVSLLRNRVGEVEVVHARKDCTCTV